MFLKWELVRDLSGTGGTGDDGGKRAHGLSRRLEALARTITRFTGSTMGFALALGTIVVWGVTGPLFHFSDPWQLVINTGTTIVMFLMVFLIQRSQSKDSPSRGLQPVRAKG